MGLLIPLYLGAQGYSVALVGALAGLGGVAMLVSRFPIAVIYRPERAVPLLVALSAAGAVSSAALPFLSELVAFALVLFVNRAASGAASAIYLARFLDAMDEGQDRRRAMGFFGGAQALGYSTSGLIVGLLADVWGYHASFLYGAFISALAGVVFLGARTPSTVRRVHAPAAPPERRAGPRGWFAALADPGLWGVLNASFWNNFFHTIQTSFFPVLGLAVGLSAGQIGLARAVYAGVNAVARPTAGVVMGRLSLRQVNYLGMVSQAVLVYALPFIPSFALFLLFSLLAGLGRAVVVVSSSAGLAEDVDETRVSRGLSTAAYSTTQDLPNSVGPFVAGFVATLLGVTGMFPVMAVGILMGFVGGDVSVARWRAQRAADSGPSERREAAFR